MLVRSGLGFGVVALVAACGLGWIAGVGCGGSGGDPGVGGDVDSGASTDSAGDDAATTCGNGIKEGIEECDDGNKVAGDGCESDCTFTCKPGDPLRGDAKCDDKNACTGTKTCTAAHTCAKGTPLADGASCGTGKICKSSACVPITCGDGIKDGTEECDDGNTVNGDGCDNTCKFSCVSTDATRDCTPTDACKGKGTCNDTKHTCTAGTPLADGASCGTAKTCKAGVCTGATCGNGTVEAGEDCDFGAGNGAGTGCEVSCKFSCTKSPDSCPAGDPCAGGNACSTVTVSGKTGQKCQAGTPLADGTACGTGKTCTGGTCTTPIPTTCGNGTLDAGEDCDFGTAGNGPGTGCEVTCKFSCTKSPDSCPAGDACAGGNTCTTNTVTSGTGTGQKCQAGTPLAACAACGAGVCVSSACRTPTCGDGCVTAPETCEPPGTATCDATCKSIVTAACGNGVRDPGEQCDDGNVVNLDGCDSKCKFEQEQRANSVKMIYDTSICTNNALGGAIQSSAQGQLDKSLTTGVKAGTTNIMFKFRNLTDLTGTSDSTAGLAVGGLGGKPVAAPAGVTYDGNNDLDWWYNVDLAGVDASRNPTGSLPASIAAKHLTAGPGTLGLTLTLSTGPATLKVTAANVSSDIGGTSIPTASSGNTPGHLATENVDPALVSFASMSNGQLCGNVSARSLATVKAPAAITGGGAINCDEGYTPTNSLLDVLVGGCQISLGFIKLPAVTKTQPDQFDPASPSPGGAGGAYSFTEDSGHHVTGCTDTSGAAVDLNLCLDYLAYSSSFTFTSDRVIVK